MTLERRTPLKRGGPIRQVSKKRQAEGPSRRRVIAAVKKRAGGRCEARFMVPEVTCWGPMDAHEVVRRSRRPGSHLEPELIILVCRGHHCWIDDHPDDAVERGLERHSWE